ncbi:TPA: hypothetical protein ACX6QU_003180 [Photobacterium damselae]
MEIKHNLREQYLTFVEDYLESSAEIKVSKHLLLQLTLDTPTTKVFWHRLDKYLREQSNSYEFNTFMARMLFHIASALDEKTDFIHPYTVSIQQEYQSLLDIYEAINTLSKLLSKLPSSALRIPPVDSTPDEQKVFQELIDATNWGEAKKQESLLDKYLSDLIPLKRDIALRLQTLKEPSIARKATQPPAKQTNNAQQVQLITELLLFFRNIGKSIPRQIIIEICHIYGFEDTDDNNVKNAQRRMSKLIKQ